MGSVKVVVSTASMAPKAMPWEKSCGFWACELRVSPTFLMAWPEPVAANARAPLQKPPSEESELSEPMWQPFLTPPPLFPATEPRRDEWDVAPDEKELL